MSFKVMPKTCSIIQEITTIQTTKNWALKLENDRYFVKAERLQQSVSKILSRKNKQDAKKNHCGKANEEIKRAIKT